MFDHICAQIEFIKRVEDELDWILVSNTEAFKIAGVHFMGVAQIYNPIKPTRTRQSLPITRPAGDGDNHSIHDGKKPE